MSYHLQVLITFINLKGDVSYFHSIEFAISDSIGI